MNKLEEGRGGEGRGEGGGGEGRGGEKVRPHCH